MLYYLKSYYRLLTLMIICDLNVEGIDDFLRFLLFLLLISFMKLLSYYDEYWIVQNHDFYYLKS